MTGIDLPPVRGRVRNFSPAVPSRGSVPCAPFRLSADRIRDMGKNLKPVVPDTDFVTKSGDWLERLGAIQIVAGVVLGLLVLLSGGNGVLLGLLPTGILFMIAGHTKKISTASAAMFILEVEKLADSRDKIRGPSSPHLG